MDSPVRQYLKQKDYRRHKLFRKIRRRQAAERQLAIDEPIRQLKRKLKRYDGGKNVPMNRSIDGINLWRDDQTGLYFYQEGNGPRIDLTPFNTLGSDDPTTWSFLDAEGKEYNPRRLYTGSKISQTTDAQRVANEVRDVLNTRTWRSDVADLLHNFGDALMWSTMAMNPEGEALMTKALEKAASLRKLVKPTFNKAALAVENYRYPFGRPQVPEGYITIKPQVRTRVGDVEIDNPGLYYHQSAAGKAENFVSTGRMRTPLEESWLAKEAAGEHIPIMLRTGVKPGYPQTPGRAMFAQGRLWYGLDPRRNPDLLVTAEEMPISTSKAGVMSRKASLRKLEDQGSRRVTDDNIYGQGPHNTQNTAAYTWEPGYGYRRVFAEKIPTLNWTDATRVPQITAENATSITPEQWTAAQDAAIARGDMAEAQRLRDLHFKVSAPNTKVVDTKGNPQLVIHKTPNNFTVFDNSRSIGNLNWAATPKAFEGENGVFATGAGPNPKDMPLYVNMRNPHYPTIEEGMEPAFINEGEDGILGIVDKDMTDYFKSSSKAGEGFHMSLGVDNPYALKSADAVTYGDNGVRIPLGERDNFNINDIRYGLLPFGIGLGTFGALYGTSDNSTFNKGKDSGIHIKPLNRGKFTALKKRTGKSASWFKAHGTPALKKMATFALNARKWKHK